MVLFVGTTLPPTSMAYLAALRTRVQLRSSAFSITRKGFSPFQQIAQSRLQSVSGGEIGETLSANESEIIFIGTGTSEGIPRVSCLTDPVKKCPVCIKAAEPGNKNRRLNTSILVRYAGPSGSRNILIDVGKFFYHSALRWFPAFGVRTIDAVIITHSHADAIGGLDDLRDWTNNVQPSVPIYVAQRDFEVMQKTHYYLVDTSVILPGAAVSELQFNIIPEEPFVVNDLKVTPLPVWHGHGYRSLGFRFGNVCYISDVSEIPEETYPLLKDCEILILDALRPDRSSSTHFGLPRALEEVRKIQPRRTLFIGMMHLMDHEEVNSYLLKLKETEGVDAQLSYDGFRIPSNLSNLLQESCVGALLYIECDISMVMFQLKNKVIQQDIKMFLFDLMFRMNIQ
ncbi:putative hydrolase C777.06c isoform X2 [Benincasa hispida]|uniref:putative hydrolase C777.06c isoform X2 n=1 Tax=Benincasa hispida TaxID=102211 RepID=UPI0018FF2BD9|nr:putative hydrolase C777.06c isoform X2 [Benincasa hispida]